MNQHGKTAILSLFEPKSKLRSALIECRWSVSARLVPANPFLHVLLTPGAQQYSNPTECSENFFQICNSIYVLAWGERVSQSLILATCPRTSALRRDRYCLICVHQNGALFSPDRLWRRGCGLAIDAITPDPSHRFGPKTRMWASEMQYRP